MQKWLSGVRGAIVLPLIWAFAWGLGGGGVMEIVDPHGEIEDVWPMIFGIPGLLAGLMFSVLLMAAEGQRRIEAPALPRFGAWGAVAGLLAGGIAVWLVGATYGGTASLVILAVATPLGAISGVGSAFLFRRVRRAVS